MESKLCARCKKDKTLSEFYRRTDGISKNQSYCSDCMKAYNKERWAKFKKRSKNNWF
tara:strand:+ start:843 stop:1013 length:171 start_codon:yes stop_codon:yes gene_type:complete